MSSTLDLKPFWAILYKCQINVFLNKLDWNIGQCLSLVNSVFMTLAKESSTLTCLFYRDI